MNRRARISKLVLFIFSLITVVLIIFLVASGLEGRIGKLGFAKILGVKEIRSEEFEKILTNKENSPDGTKQILRYKFYSNPELFLNYRDYLDNNTFIAVKNLVNNQESYIFVGEERIGDPHWLDNNYIFFTNYCGTSCKGIYLVNTLDKTTKQAVISYFFEKNGPWQTHFKDWFGENLVFPGLIKNIKAKLDKGKAILIFKRDNGWGTDLEDKLFLFKENRLVPLEI